MIQNIPYYFNPFPVYKRGSIEPPQPIPLTAALTFKGKSNSNAIALNQVRSPSAITLQYSKNDGPWTAYTIGDTITLNQNETVAFSGANDHFSKNNTNCYNFAMTGTIEAGGNIQSLMNFSDTAPRNCFVSLFSGCTSLTDAPALPASGLNFMCYAFMFFGCTSLSSAPQLSATTLAANCYQSMFRGCTSLTDAPYLSATELVTACYDSMFHGCTNLSSINVAFTNWNVGPVGGTAGWVYGVAQSGVFTKPDALSTAYNDSRIPVGWTIIHQNGQQEEYDYYTTPLTFYNDSSVQGNTLLYMQKNGSPATMNLNYSRDGITWNSWNPYGAENGINLYKGDTVYISGNNNQISDGGDYNHNVFVTSGAVGLKVYGNVNSLVNFGTGRYSYSHLFYNDSQIVDAKNLKFPSKHVGMRAFLCMFEGCTNLSAAPSDIDVQEFDDQSYYCLFCAFKNCTSLVKAPFIHATTVNTNTYQGAFDGCTSLRVAPLLIADSYQSYTWNCFEAYVSNCTSLSAMEVVFTSWPNTNSATYQWVYNVGSTGIFIKPQNLSIIRGIDNIPNNWIVLNRINGLLYYAEAVDGHSIGDSYTGEDPYAWYYN